MKKELEYQDNNIINKVVKRDLIKVTKIKKIGMFMKKLIKNEVIF